MVKRPIIVISAVNLIEGGTLSVLQDCLDYVASKLCDKYKVIVLVNSKSQFNYPKLDFIEFPWAKRSWLLRLYYEYWFFRSLSRKVNAELWLSLHDTTPNVIAKRRAVYCHNPAPFYSISIWEVYIDPIFAIFNLFYKWVYRINIHKNCFVIVQQEWLKKKFQSLFGPINILVAHPEVKNLTCSKIYLRSNMEVIRFFYPAFPRCFKNFELICEASKKLLEENIDNFEVIMTIDGSESRYAKSIVKRYENIQQLKFIGLLQRNEVYEIYPSIDCLVFPSKLETWGLPITEFKFLNRPILAAKLDYARETVGDYPYAKFFDCNNSDELAKLMLSVINHGFDPDVNQYTQPESSYSNNWNELFDALLTDK